MTHKHIYAPDELCLEPFAAKFGYTRADWEADGDLERSLMDDYLRDRGHVPTDSWYLVVHPDGSSDFTPFDENNYSETSEMPCCKDRERIAGELDAEIAIAGTPPILRRDPD